MPKHIKPALRLCAVAAASTFIFFSCKQNFDRKLEIQGAIAPPTLASVAAERKIHPRKLNVPVLMFHTFDYKGSMANSPYNMRPFVFRRRLSELDRMGYTLVTARQFRNGDFSKVPRGRKPILLTFDDAWASHISFSKNGKLDDSCAIKIINVYAKAHPRFGKCGLFFISFDKSVFGGNEKEGLEALYDMGYSIGAHSYSHARFDNISLKNAKKEIANFNLRISESLGADFKTPYFAYPYGAIPKNEAVDNYLLSQYRFLFKVSGGPALVAVGSGPTTGYVPRMDACDLQTWRELHRFAEPQRNPRQNRRG